MYVLHPCVPTVLETGLYISLKLIKTREKSLTTSLFFLNFISHLKTVSYSFLYIQIYTNIYKITQAYLTRKQP